MKTVKKALALLCTLSLTLAVAAPALAAEESTTVSYAYMDTALASPQLKDQILAARSEIIYAADAGWSIDGTATVTHADGTVEVLPKFSDLYPGWNLTEISNYNYRTATYAAGTSSSYSLRPDLLADESGYYYYDTVALAVTTSGSYFCSFNAASEYGRVRAETLPGSKWSAAVRNDNTYKEEAYKGNMQLGDQLNFTTVENVRYSVRASSPDKAGDATILVAIVQ